MSALLRTVDADAEQWSLDSREPSSRDANGPAAAANEGDAAERERMARVDACASRREELLRAALATRVRALREYLERRE